MRALISLTFETEGTDWTNQVTSFGLKADGWPDRNVDNVLKNRDTAHPRLSQALVADDLKFGKATQFCKFTKDKQLELPVSP